MVDEEIVGIERAMAPAQAAEEAVEHRPTLGLARLEFGADDRREVADVLGDQEVGLHETLDAGQAAAIPVAEPIGEPSLQVEAEPLLGAAGHEMHVAANPPQE